MKLCDIGVGRVYAVDRYNGYSDPDICQATVYKVEPLGDMVYVYIDGFRYVLSADAVLCLWEEYEARQDGT